VKPASHRFFPRQSGQFTELVERRFADAIKHLEATRRKTRPDLGFSSGLMGFYSGLMGFIVI